MTPGRPPKPPEMRILDGTHRDDRHGKPEEQVHAAGTPQKPELFAEASALWDQLVPGLTARGIVGESDQPMLVVMCEWGGLYRRSMAALAKLKGMGSKTARVLTMQAAEASRHFETIACRFGLTPADRAKLRVSPEKKAGVASRKRA